MRARIDRRDGEVVEGILHIRHIPSLDSVDVVVLVGHRAPSVDPSSIEVLEANAVPVEEVEDGDPLLQDPRRRRIASLEEAMRDDLIVPPIERVGGSWEDLFAELHRRAEPMLAAGWRLIETDRDESWEYGDSVFYCLERAGVRVDLEYYEHGQLVAYPESADDPGAGEPAEPLFSIYDTTPATAHAAFVEHDLL